MLCKRLWTMGFWWLIVLTCLNVILTTKLLAIHPHENSGNSQTPRPQSQKTNSSQISGNIIKIEAPIFNTTRLFSSINLDLGRYDNSRQFKVFDNVFVGKKFIDVSKDFDVTLATQSSFDRLHWLIYVAKFWSGPISVAVFVPDVEFEMTIIYLKKLISCVPEIRERVAIHFVYPIKHSPKRIVIDEPLKRQYNCSDLTFMMKELFKSINLKNNEFQHWRTAYPYPQSHMRNVARKSSQTNYVFVTDIDIVPSKDSAEGLSKFLGTNQCKKCAFVVPVYEIDRKTKFPETKKDLKELIKQKKARPFHKTVFLQSHYATNSSWYERDQDDSVVHISHSVTNYEFYYEPFYIAIDSAPEYDERFLGYGFTRNTQVFEMWASGWTFHVISPIFAVHYGFQEKRARPGWREMQNNRNRAKLERFKAEIDAKYSSMAKLGIQSTPRTHR